MVGRGGLAHDDPVTTTARSHQESRAARVLVAVGIVVLAFNLRPAAVSVGPVLHEMRAGLGMSPTTAGVLTTLPVLAFASFGAVAPALARVVGVHRVTLLALGAVVVGLSLRARTDSVAVLLALSLLALGGMATANVLLPSLVKLHFPRRVGLMTSLYTTSLAVGLTVGLGADGPGQRAARVLALGARRLGGDRAGRRTARGSRCCVTTSPRRRRRTRSRWAPWRAPGSAGPWRRSSASSRCRPTRSSAGSHRSTGTPGSAPVRRACCSASSPG